MELEKILVVGQGLGYTGVTLQTFMKDELARMEEKEKGKLEREEKARKRDEQDNKDRLAREERALKREEQDKKDRLAREEKALEREERALEREDRALAREQEKLVYERECRIKEEQERKEKVIYDRECERKQSLYKRECERTKIEREKEQEEKEVVKEKEKLKYDRECESERLIREYEKLEREEQRETERLEKEELKEIARLEREEKNREYERECDKERLEREEKNQNYERECDRERVEREEERMYKEDWQKDERLGVDKGRLELDRQRLAKGVDDTSQGNNRGGSGSAVRVPPFEEHTDSMDAYIGRFERIARTQGWSKVEWVTRFSASLKGKALEIYMSLSDSEMEDFDGVKLAMLKQYEMTGEGFRRKFRNGKLETGELFSRFVSRMGNYLKRWVELGGTDKTYEGMIDLLLQEQLLNVVGHDLKAYLTEKAPADIKEMASLAERYVDAWGPASGKTSRISNSPGQNERHNSQKVNVPARPSKPNSDRGSYVPGLARRCYNCQRTGHVARQCRNPHVKLASIQVSKPVEKSVLLPRMEKETSSIDRVSSMGRATEGTAKVSREGDIMATGSMYAEDWSMPFCEGKVNGKLTTVLRDSGCNGVIVRMSLVSDEDMTSEIQACRLADSRVLALPVAWITIDTPFYTGKLRAACMETPLCDLILGNIPGVREPKDPDLEWGQVHPVEVSAVETRGQRKVRQEGMKPLKTLQTVSRSLTREQFISQQQQDLGLDKVRTMIRENKVRKTMTSTSFYHMERDMLYRTYTSTKYDNGKSVMQAVVPAGLRSDVMQVCHESLMGGHLGSKKTLDRVTSQFYWPGVVGDVRRHVMSCDICQRTIAKGKVRRIPLGQMPLIEVPFERIAVDLIGPLYPVTDKGNRYILTVVDYATRYPEAVPLPRIETEYVAEALFEIFSRVGIPKEILTDMGTQFTSGVMREVSRLLSLHQLTTTPYHPMCNGLVERFNGTLKTMLKRMCSERPQDWDRYLPALLFAYREVPQESLGFAPFELLYGRTVRGPVQILREVWTKDIENPEVRTTYDYVLDLQNRLEETLHMAQEELKKSQGRYKKYYNAKAKIRKMKPGDKVLVLLPTDNNKLLMHWKGPYDVLETFGVGNYRVQVGTKVKTYHANLLKRYIERIHVNHVTLSEVSNSDRSKVPGQEHVERDVSISSLLHAGAGLVDMGTEEVSTLDIQSPPLVAKETYRDVDVSEDLSAEQRNQVHDLLVEFQDVLSELPGKVDCIEYKIRLTCSDPIRSKPYPLPHHMREVVRKEVQTMLNLGVIEPSESPYASPIVLVKKPDDSYRFCSDYRKINQITVFDSEPIPLAEALFARLATCKYFTKIDISKAYWQIPMEPSSKEKTAFITPDGLYQWRVMPFGVVNAPAVFSRLMRRVLQDIPDVDNYIDDILEGTEEWDAHLVSLRAVFTRLRTYQLTARPSKVKIGYSQIDFLGHQIGEGCMQPEGKNVKKILAVGPPKTKKQVRALIGLTSYYRKFIPNFAAIAVPLTDLTKKGRSNQVVWTESQDIAFQTLRRHMATFPILRLPDLTKVFLVRTDASEVGIGAVLLQEEEGVCFPIMYVSRKLLDRERVYSTIEKECLAIVWAVQKLERYLYGREFILETDHQPLVWMAKAKLANGRIMRWALALQPYRFVIRAIRGADNVGADLLSRCLP